MHKQAKQILRVSKEAEFWGTMYIASISPLLSVNDFRKAALVGWIKKIPCLSIIHLLLDTQDD